MGAGGDAVAAADAFGMVGGAEHIHIHFAHLGASPTGGTLVPVYIQAVEGDPVEQGVERPKGTDPLAEGPVEERGQHYHAQQDTAFPGEQPAQAGADAGVRDGQGDASL